MELAGWQVLDEERGVWWREYEFSRKAWATTLAFRAGDGVVVLSPASQLEDRALDALSELGPVRALVATNSMHHLGQARWRARFPDARSYAPKGACAAVQKRVSGGEVAPLSDLALPAHVHFREAPGFKKGETILAIEGTRGPIWFTGDLLTNIERTPGPPLRWLFTATGSAFGFRLFRLGVWALVADKAAVREWTLARFAELPPRVIVPAHGPPIEADDLAERAAAELRKL